MELKKKIILDYADAKDNGQRLLRFALEDLQPLANGRLNQNELLNSIEHLIEKVGQSIINKARNRKNVETDVFKMVLFNNYITEFKLNNKTRRIVLEYSENDEINQSWDSKSEIPPKVIVRKKNLFNIFKINI